jgi:hypothetical protein
LVVRRYIVRAKSGKKSTNKTDITTAWIARTLSAPLMPLEPLEEGEELLDVPDPEFEPAPEL